MKKLITIFTLIILMFGCSSKNSESYIDAEAAIAAGASIIKEEQVATTKFSPPEIVKDEENVISPPPPAPNTPKKIIHTADIRFKVDNLQKAESSIKARVQALGGYISNTNQNRQSGNLENSWTVRIPAEKFEAFLGEVEKESVYTDSKNVSAEDVTAEYVDNELRIKSKQKVFERYLELLKQAKNVQDIMAVEEQIRVIREEIEAKEGRQKYLNDQVSYSTITLSFYQETESSSAPEQPFYVKIWKNFVEGWNSFFAMIIGLFYLIPYFLVLGGMIYLLKKWWGNRKNS
ncbi:MAG: DUF4349 domain-containing protein [Arcicella sp.]|nr:DUF4349 domain-containing protein [Arcicella sp.]